MQPIIDAILELIKPTDLYVDRGDIPSADYVITDFVVDGNWHDWDVSAIVPENVTAVNLRFTMRATRVDKSFLVRTAGNVNTGNISLITSQVANQFNSATTTVYPSASRHLEYNFTSAFIDSIFIAINGWWLKKNI